MASALSWQTCKERLDERAEKIALELVFAEAGKDNGLLPINSLLSELEEMAAPTDLPGPLAEGLRLARKCVDTALAEAGFSAETLRRLNLWIEWLRECSRAASEGSLPALPDFGTEASAAKPAPPATAETPAASETPQPLHLNFADDQELLREFISESHEHLQNIELGVLTLEENPTDRDTLNSIFRAFHTFKGGSGFLNLTPINRLAHELESLLDLARQHRLRIDSATINLILQGGDTLQQFILEMEAQLGGQKPHAPILIPTETLLRNVRAVVSPLISQDPGAPPAPANAPTAILQPPRDPPPVETAAVRPAPGAKTSDFPRSEKGTGNASVVKVDTQKLDALMDLVGELVITQSLVNQDTDRHQLSGQRLARNLGQLARITNELQRAAMSLRMVPIRSTFQKMTRLVRDLSVKAGKQVELQMAGEETEVDRSIVEEINDPLVHMIRNAVDHGIEAPETRLTRDKRPYGTIFLRAYHQSGNIIIEVKDDGAGLNKEKIRRKAVEKGLLEGGAPLSDKEVYELIFAPGFSTADQVTDISGRGVGMDVVRRNIEKLRGKVEIDSTEGQGTKFMIYLPLTLAIIDGMIVGVGNERYILPTLSVRESFRPTRAMIATVHERGEMVQVRGRLIPLLRLGEYLHVPPQATTPTEGIVVVVEFNGETRCLLVDQLLGKQEVVIKSLGETLRHNPVLAGATILGDGRVGLILDVNLLVKTNSAQLANAA